MMHQFIRGTRVPQIPIKAYAMLHGEQKKRLSESD
jgi:hypothetical protein